MTENNADSPPPKSSGLSFGGAMLVMLLLAAIGAGGYYWKEIDIFLKELSPPATVDAPIAPRSEQAETTPAIDAQKETISKLETRIAKTEARHAELEKQLAETQQTVSALETRLTVAEDAAKQPPAPTPEATASLAAPIDNALFAALEKKIADLEAKLSEAPPSPSAPAVNADYTAQMEALKLQIENSNAEIAKITDQLGSEKKISTYENQMAWNQVVVLMQYDTLKERVLSGKPFEAEYGELESAIGDNEKAAALLEKLKPHRLTGLVTADRLKETFAHATKAALFEHALPADADTWNRFTHNLSGLVKVRKVGKEQQGKSDEAIIARAEAALTENHLEQAQNELKGLSKDAAAAFAEWNRNANALTAATATLAELKTTLVKPAENTLFYER